MALPASKRASNWRIVGARHAGITVSDLGRSLAFYRDELGLELLWRRVYEEPEIREIVGVAEATSFDIAMLRVPGSDLEIELLEYRGCEQEAAPTEPSTPGTGHLCLFVRSIEACFDDLSERGVRFRSGGPVELTAGRNRGGKSLYSTDPDGYVVEFHEPPPHLLHDDGH